jgi:hypothetical protein
MPAILRVQIEKCDLVSAATTHPWNFKVYSLPHIDVDDVLQP